MRPRLKQYFGRADRFIESFNGPVSAQSLAVLRMAFGLIMAYDVWRFFHYDRIHRYYDRPEFWFNSVEALCTRRRLSRRLEPASPRQVKNG